MAAEEFINTSTELIPDLVVEVGKLAIWFQALGIIILFWLVFNIISLIINFKRKKLLTSISEDLKRIEKKVNKLSKK